MMHAFDKFVQLKVSRYSSEDCFVALFEDYHLPGTLLLSDFIIFRYRSFCMGDLLQWSGFADLGLAELGFAISVAIVSDGTCVALFNTLQKSAGNDLRKRHGAVTVVRVTDMVGAVPYTSENELVSPMWIAS